MVYVVLILVDAKAETQPITSKVGDHATVV